MYLGPFYYTLLLQGKVLTSPQSGDAASRILFALLVCAFVSVGDIVIGIVCWRAAIAVICASKGVIVVLIALFFLLFLLLLLILLRLLMVLLLLYCFIISVVAFVVAAASSLLA